MGMIMRPVQYSSHIPVLIKALRMTTGTVLEMGTGFFSTPIIHWLCIPRKRRVVSMERESMFIEMAKQYAGPLHEVVYVKDWNSVKIEKKWGLALVDHEPAGQRRLDIPRLAKRTQLIVVHDTSPQQRNAFHYDDIWPLFKYVYHYWDVYPGTSLLSNFIDLDGLNIWE